MDRHGIARRVRELAGRPALAPRRDELTALADALGAPGTDRMEPWADLDLLHSYARPESLDSTGPAPAEPRFWAYAEGVLGALVFVPLLLTWYGLTRASSAYQALTGADPEAATRPFLQLWQSGFEGHLAGAFTFGHVAMSATAAIAVLFAVALVHGLRRSAVTRRAQAAERAREELMAQLVPALTRAQLVLHGQRRSSPGRFAAELTGAAETLGRLGDSAVRVQQDLTTAANAIGESVAAAERRLAGVDTSLRPLETAAGRIEAAVADGGDRVGRALDDVQRASDGVRLAVEDAGDRVEESVTVLAAAQRAHTTGIEVSSDISAQLHAALGNIAQDTARAVAESMRSARELAAQTEALRVATEQFARLTTELRADPAVRTVRLVDGPAPEDTARAARAYRESGEYRLQDPRTHDHRAPAPRGREPHGAAPRETLPEPHPQDADGTATRPRTTSLDKAGS